MSRLAELSLLSVMCICLLIGGGFHIYDNLAGGFLPYRFVPMWINIYWTALALFDVLAAYLLIAHRRSGLALALLIMLSDVGINSYALYGLDVFPSPAPLQLQSLFLGFTVAATIALWRRQSAIR